MVDKNKIYAVSKNGKKPNHIALYADANFPDFDGICYLTPPDRGHMIDGKLGKETRDGFTFKREGGGTLEFIEVTYENFKTDYHKMVEGGKEILSAVSNTQELQDWYHQEYPI